ncbi:MAG: Fpg/Nei family DNA glycosylase [Deltaproteobacteria bacterium]|nr:Fpg/Nei family DNA glycosylase [Deltaproteobacteria bacterium]
MPEGDTIHRIANRLADLVGQAIVRVTTQGLVRDLATRTITAIAAHGKHLVIDLDDGTAIRTHLRMYGRFRREARGAGEAILARSSPGRITLAITLPDSVLLWFGARTVEISSRRSPMRGMAVAALGPDILADHFDSRLAASRAAQHPARAIGDVLLDQRVVAGIGNVYKSEVLFLRSVDPRTLIAALSEPVLATIYAEACTLMRANLGPGPRTTRVPAPGDLANDDRYFVYGRTNRPCRRCGASIRCYALGEPPRWTWSCPDCQPEEAPGGASR